MENLTHIACTLYHRKIQYANIRPHGRDEKQKKSKFSLTFHSYLRANFIFFKQKSKKGGVHDSHVTKMTKEKNSLLQASGHRTGLCTPSRYTHYNTPS